jgi:peptide/nickel transport system substrate-binding protein
MKRLTTILFVLFVCVMVFGMQAGWAADAKVLRVGWLSEPKTLDPVGPSDNPSLWALHNVHDTLVRVSNDSNSIEPDLAKSWEVSADNLTYTFHLRQGLKFHNGDDVTAEDVVFSLDRTRNPKECPYSSMFDPIKEIQAVDKDTVKIVLSAPYAPILADLAMFNAAIIPKKYFQEVGGTEKFGRHPIGAGPFKFEYWKPGEEIMFSKFDDYWREGLPKVDKLSYLIMPDATSRAIAVRGGAIDVAVYVPFNEVQSLKAAPGVKVAVDPIWRHDFVKINCGIKPFNDIKVRQALNYAVNKEGIIKAVLFGFGKAATSYMPLVVYYNSDLQPYPYDPTKAKALLKSAGYEKGFKTAILTTAGEPMMVSIATILQQNLQDIGIQASIEKVEEGTRWDRLVARKYELSPDYYTSDILDDDLLTDFGISFAGNQAYFSDYNSPKVEELAALGRKTLDEKKRAGIYHEIQKTVMEDAAQIFLTTTPTATAMRDNVQGLIVPASNFYRWEYVSLE